ncbi:MAG: urea carboxylase-associated family protein [Sphingorhabdus sp.]
MRHEIEPKSGAGFSIKRGQELLVIDPFGEQVADLVAYNADDPGEVLSNGRTLDYASTIYLTKGHLLYSNHSRVMLEIVEDDVGRHDFLLTPCSRDTFRIIYGEKDPCGGCFENLTRVLAPFSIPETSIPVAFNCFMNVEVDGQTGAIKVLPPRSKAGDTIRFRAAMDLVIGLTACSALQSNNGSFKPIQFEIFDGG